MSDFYRELESTVGGRRRGLGLLGWLTIACVGFFGLVGVLAWAGFVVVRGRVQEALARTEGSPAEVAVRMLTRLDPELALPRSPGDAGAPARRDLPSGALSSLRLDDLVEGSLRLNTAEGELRLELRGGEEGGTLVVESPEGRATAELTRGEEGGTLVVRAPDGTLRLAAGSEALPLPGWLPREGGMPEQVRHLYSAETEDGTAGAVAWRSDGRPERVLELYRERLSELGMEVRGEGWSAHRGARQGSLWAEDPDGGRSAFVIAAREDGRTSVLLGYRERR